MKQLVILSGKGGTGKTTVAAALAHLASPARSLALVDADVDASNLELVLAPVRLETHEFRAGKVAVIDQAACTACGRCSEVCRFEAIVRHGDSYRVDPVACEGCASCSYQCPADAIQLREQSAGEWYRSDTWYGPLFHAHLFAGQENSGKLVSLVRQKARVLSAERGCDLVIVDGPPGIGCPVIAAATGADLALLVTEPTVSGIHDLERILSTTDHFQVPAVVVVNKADVNPHRADDIAAFCIERGINVAGHIPFDTAVTRAIVDGKPITAYAPDGQVTHCLRQIWEQLCARLMLCN